MRETELDTGVMSARVIVPTVVDNLCADIARVGSEARAYERPCEVARLGGSEMEPVAAGGRRRVGTDTEVECTLALGEAAGAVRGHARIVRAQSEP